MNTMQEMCIVGQVDAIFFENPNNLYKVMRINVDLDETNALVEQELTLTGQFAAIHLDTTYEFYGQLVTHPKYGEQFQVTRYQQRTPTTENGLIDYLSSDRFKGIGKKLAERIVETLGMDAINVILSTPDVLKTIKGLTPEKRTGLYNTLLVHQGTEKVYMQLTEWGFGPKISERIYKAFQSQAIEKIKENPYVLVSEVTGIGFNIADKLAEQLGIEPLSIERIVASQITVVSEICNHNGDTYVKRERVIEASRTLLETSRPVLIDTALLEMGLDKAVLDKALYVLDEGYMLPSLYYAETGAVLSVDQFVRLNQTAIFSEEKIDEAIQYVIRQTKIQYDGTQQAALKVAIQSPLSIITGGPGTGKTTLIKGLITLHAYLHEYDLDEHFNQYELPPVLLAAPTGRAAKRMSEMTGLPASTIHRLLGYNRESSLDEFEPYTLDGKLLIVDEMSMVDTWLLHWLMKAIPYTMQVVFVGDQDQLPSVGPGRVFADLIESNTLPVISLSKIYRQAQNSSIIRLAHNIRQSILPQDLLVKQSDRSFIPCQSAQVTEVVGQIVTHAKQKGYTAERLQVLAPMYKGVAGITALNTLIQSILNPPASKKREVAYFDQIFRVGDKVLQLVNNADEGVYNGDIGWIEAIYKKGETDSGSDEMIISFDEKELVYKRGDFDQLTLAYCCSVHKSQGSEYPLVILPMVESYSRMLRRDLLYTAVTRAKESLILLGDPNSFVTAVEKLNTMRYTNLKDLLQTKLQESTELMHDDIEEDEVNSDALISQEEAVFIVQRDESPTNQWQLPDILTEETMWQVDPLIGMANMTPFDFL